jgi:hypothetical protein
MASKKDDGAIGRKRKFVQQRAKELEARGKTVDRAKLRRKWETGMVERNEFYAPGERARLRAGSKAKKAAPGKPSRPPVDRMPEKKAPKQGKPADRMPQGGPKRAKPADRYPSPSGKPKQMPGGLAQASASQAPKVYKSPASRFADYLEDKLGGSKKSTSAKSSKPKPSSMRSAGTKPVKRGGGRQLYR